MLLSADCFLQQREKEKTHFDEETNELYHFSENNFLMHFDFTKMYKLHYFWSQ